MNIGILGGIGAEASSTFYHKLIHSLKNSLLISTNKDYPHIILNHIPAVEILGYGDDNIDEYIQGIRELLLFEPMCICMICNTIHIYYDQIAEATGADQIVNLPVLVEKEIKKSNDSVYTILGTPNSLKHNLYTFKDVRYDNPDEHLLSIIEQGILDFNTGRDYSYTQNVLRNYIDVQTAKHNGKVKFIYGCTEIIDLVGAYNNTYIDTMNVMLDHLMEIYKLSKN